MPDTFRRHPRRASGVGALGSARLVDLDLARLGLASHRRREPARGDRPYHLDDFRDLGRSRRVRSLTNSQRSRSRRRPLPRVYVSLRIVSALVWRSDAYLLLLPSGEGAAQRRMRVFARVHIDTPFGTSHGRNEMPLIRPSGTFSPGEKDSRSSDRPGWTKQCLTLSGVILGERVRIV